MPRLLTQAGILSQGIFRRVWIELEARPTEMGTNHGRDQEIAPTGVGFRGTQFRLRITVVREFGSERVVSTLEVS